MFGLISRKAKRSRTFWVPVIAALVLGGLWSAPATAAPVLSADTLTLLPNTPGQLVKIYVSGGETVLAEDLNFQINSGITGPTITGVDIITGTIFAASNTGQNVPSDGGLDAGGIFTLPPYAGRLAIVETSVLPGDQTMANGLLATLTISTQGLSNGTFTLNMIDTVNGPSDFVLADGTPLSMTFPSNVFTIVPEPASVAALGMAMVVLLGKRNVRA